MQKETLEGYQLSHQQKHIWLLQQPEQSVAYRALCAVLIEGELDEGKLSDAIAFVASRHEILNTTFQCLPGMALPLQVIDDSNALQIIKRDLSALMPEQQEGMLESLFDEARRSDFDLEQGPVLQLSLVRLAHSRHVLLISLPALCADAAALDNLANEINRSYSAGVSGEAFSDEPLQYADIAAWQNELLESEATEAGKQYWRKVDALNLLNVRLPFEAEREHKQEFQPASLAFTVDQEKVAKTKSLAAHRGKPIEALLLACWRVLIGRLTRQPDVIIGALYDGRRSDDLKNALGLLSKYLPIRCLVQERARFAGVLEEIDELSREAGELQEYWDWEYGLAPASNSVCIPFFRICFDWEESAMERASSGAQFSICKRYTCIDRFNLKLSCFLKEESLRTQFHYDAAIFRAQDIERLAGQFHALLENVVSDPEAAIDRMEILSAVERQQLLIDFNNTKAAYPRDLCLHLLFEQQAKYTPDNVAIAFKQEQLTYFELNARVNQLAHHLRRLGVGPEAPVAVYVERTPEMVIALLGILKAGGAFVPLDTSYPRERLAFMLEDAGARVLLTQSALVEALPKHAIRVVLLDGDYRQISQESRKNPANLASPENLAYVIYTSGSTGKPKGVMIHHRGVVNYLTWCIRAYEVAEGSAAPVHSPISFDLTITSLFAPLLAGRRVILVPEDEGISGLGAALRAEGGFSLIKITPSHLNILSQLLPAEEAEGRTTRVILGGEALFAESLSFWSANAPGTIVVNEYGPTETVVGCCIYESPAAKLLPGAVAIGHPISNMQVYLLDHYLHPVAIDFPGEIYIGGEGVARGYLNRPDVTAERFIPDLFSKEPGARIYKTGDQARFSPDGNIQYLGRLDHQLKIRGYRVELGEIESLLEQHPGVQQAIVLAREDEVNDKRLVACVVPHQQQAFAIRQLLRLERNGLPANLQPYDLPNGMTVIHLNRNETEYLYEEIFQDQIYLQHGIALNDGDCIFDVGANIGMFSLFMSSLRKHVKIFAFEPIPPIFEALRLNSQLYNLDIELFNCGLTNETRDETFLYYPHLSLISGRFAGGLDEREVVKAFELNRLGPGAGSAQGWSEEALDSVLAERLNTQSYTCPLRSISDVIREHHVERIDLLKIDAEKSEQDILDGISVEDWGKIKQIIVEVHDIDGRLSNITTLLENYGFEVFVKQEAALKRTNLYDVYAVRSSRVAGPESYPIRESNGHTQPHWSSRNAFANDLQTYLKEKLPQYMVPLAYVLLDEMPLTENGKVDREALSTLGATQTRAVKSFVAPHTEAEKIIASIWRQVLKVDQVGTLDNFFELGGHSLLLIEVHSMLREPFKRDLPITDLFKYPTISSLANHLSQVEPDRPDRKVSLRVEKLKEGKDRLRQQLNRGRRVVKELESAFHE